MWMDELGMFTFIPYGPIWIDMHKWRVLLDLINKYIEYIHVNLSES